MQTISKIFESLDIMEDTEFKKLHSDNNKTLYLTTSKYLFENFQIKRWKLNRQKDDARIQEIKKSFEHIKMVPGIIYLWKTGICNCPFIYGKQHVYESTPHILPIFFAYSILFL